MQNGDLSNTIEPRLLVVFEGLLGLHTGPADRAKFTVDMKWHRFKAAIRTFALNGQMQKVIWDTAWRVGYAVDVVTFLDERLVSPLIDYLDEVSLPIGHVTYAERGMLARSLAFRPDVAGVFFAAGPQPDFTFGSKGYATSVDHPVMIGVLGQHGSR